MIKKILEIFCVFLVVQLLVYSVVAFVCWEINPGNWTDDARFITVLLGGVFGFGAISAYIALSDYEQKK